MFDYDAEQVGFSAPIFVFQLIGAPLGTLIAGVALSAFVEGLLGVKNGNLIPYVCFALEGFLFGYTYQTSRPRAYQSGGRWIWIPPVCLLAWGVLDELFRRRGTAVLDFFDTSRPGPGVVLAVGLLTLPAIATCFYSIGVITARRRALSRWRQNVSRTTKEGR